MAAAIFARTAEEKTRIRIYHGVHGGTEDTEKNEREDREERRLSGQGARGS
jgi:hypothetical protein